MVARSLGDDLPGVVWHGFGIIDHAHRIAVPGCGTFYFTGDAILDDTDTNYLCTADDLPRLAPELGQPSQPVVVVGPRLDPVGQHNPLTNRTHLRSDHDAGTDIGTGRLSNLDSGSGRKDERLREDL